MPILTKHTDLLILGTAAVLALGGVLAFEYSNPDATSENQPLITPVGQSTPRNRLEPQKSETVSLPVTKTPAWLDHEQAGHQELTRPVPAALEKGVVHLGPGAALGGKRPFPDDNPWNQRVDQVEIDPLSDVIIAAIGGEKSLYGDFGAGSWNGAPIGIPYVIVEGTQARAHIKYTAYGDESDPGPYPVPRHAPIEGDPNQDGDRHVLVIDRDNWQLYELFRAFPIAEGQLWRADSGAIFDLSSNAQRPLGWTSADAAGLPIFPGLVRYDEAVEIGEIRHALRFTVSKSRSAYVPPASHWASRFSEISLPPMGMRVRLKESVDISSFPKEVQVILLALKRYGMILADNGSDWFLSGAPDPRWNDENLRTLKQLQGHDFEVILMEGLVEE